MILMWLAILFSGHFSWEKYLKETGAIAAPSACFRQVCKSDSFKRPSFTTSCYHAASLTFISHQHPERHTSSQWVQGWDEAGGPRPAKHHIHLHCHGGRSDRLKAAPAPGRVRQQERLLAPGWLLRDPANRKLWEKRRHAAAAPW